MNIRQLQVFAAVCAELNFTRAAQKLYMTQPAVSHVIADLERETGCVLFDRIARKIYLTQAGALFLEKATRLLELYGGLFSCAPDLEQKAPIRIGSCITIANFHLPQMMQVFKKECGETPFSILVDSARHIQSKLLKNEIDVALIEGVIPHACLEKHAFSSFEIAAVCSPDYPAAKKGALSIAQFTAEDLLLREQGSAIRDALDSALLLHNAAADPKWTSVNSQALIEAAKAGLGISVLAKALVEKELAHGRLKELTVQGLSLTNTNYVAFHRDKYLSAPLKFFIDIVRSKKPPKRTVSSF